MYYHETLVKERIRFEHIFLQFGNKVYIKRVKSEYSFQGLYQIRVLLILPQPQHFDVLHGSSVIEHELTR